MSGAHLILAHLVESDPTYAKFYADLDDGKPKIMDNSAFEMFKLGKSMYPSEKLIDLGKKVDADYIVMTDYPKDHWTNTVNKAKEMMPELKAAGFKTFFCPQSVLGDLEGLLTSIEWALKEPGIDLIGLSILACPIACGVNETAFSGHFHKAGLEHLSNDGKRNDAYKMQRFLSRWKVLTELKRRGSLKYVHDKFHCLGMVDGPNEIDLLSEFHQHIFSWDSSAAVWAGLNYIRFDQSPSGLMDGKFEHEVNFDHATCDLDSIKDAMYNCSFINKKVK